MNVTSAELTKQSGPGQSNGHGNGAGRARSDAPSLHIEWTPEGVRTLDIVSGRRAEGANFSAIAGRLNVRSALVGVGHSSVFIKTIRLPKATPDDLRNIIAVQLGTLFPLPADQLSFDFQQTADQTPDGFLTTVAAIRSDDLKRIRQEMASAGMSASRILPMALAAPAVAKRSGLTDALVAERENGSLALDVVQDGVLCASRVVAFANDPVTEIRRTLAAARAEDAPVLTVGALDIPQSTPSMESLLGLLHEAAPLNFELQEERQIALKKHIDQRTRLGIYMVLAAVCFVVGVWFQRADQLAQLARSQTAWNGKITLQTDKEQLELSRLAAIMPVSSTVTRAFDAGQKLSDIIAVVADSLPKNAWLTGMTLQRGVPMEIRGTAETPGDVGALVSRLGANPRFRDVRLVFANSGTIDKTPIVQFDISAVCVGNLPMPEPIKTKPRAPGVPGTASTAVPANTASTGAAQ